MKSLYPFMLLLSLSVTSPAYADELSSKLKTIVESHHGTVTVCVKDLESGETLALEADQVMPTASLIKLAIMVEAYSQAAEKKLDLAKTLTLTKSDKVPGSGILTHHFSDGATFPVKDAIRLMIVFSDNTATNLVLDQVGMKAVNSRMASLGFKETRVNAKVYKPETRIDQERGKKYGLGSTTAKESVELLEMLHAGKVAGPAECKTMLDHLKECDDKEKIPRFLPPGTVVMHKTGSVNASKTDAGIIFVPSKADPKKTRPIALCVMTTDNKDQRWVLENEGQVTIARIAKEVYEHYSQK